MKAVIIAAIIVGAIGLAFGLLLAFASVIFKVETDERIEKIEELLPGANCGGCGFAGCSAYAHAIVEENAPINCCNALKSDKVNKIGEIMGKKVETSLPKVARVMCQGSKENATNKYTYEGVKDCYAANRLGGGPKDCAFGCLGFGSCVSACKFDAIHIIDGVAVVDEEKCTACGMCAKTCPKKLIEIVPKNSVSVLCKNKLIGKEVMTSCKKGCIACKICEKNCPFEAIQVRDNLAVIDYEKCKNCGLCEKKCPKTVINKF